MHSLSNDEVEAFDKKMRDLSNRGQFKEVYSQSRRYSKKYPNVFLFAYMEVVFTAEDTTGMSRTKADRLYVK